MTRVFISYRRDETADLAARIVDRLTAQFGARNVTMGPVVIPPGVNMRAYLAQFLASVDVVVVILGQGFLRPADGVAWAPVYDPSDGMRMEIEAALGAAPRRPLLLPLLAHGATMPDAHLLPPSLQALPYTQALTIRADPDFATDFARVAAAIRAHNPTASAMSSASTSRIWGRYPWLRVLSPIPCLCALIGIVAGGLEKAGTPTTMHTLDAFSIIAALVILVFLLTMPTVAIASWVLAAYLRKRRWLAVLVITSIGLVFAFLFPNALGSVPALLGLSGIVTPFLFSLTLK